jgi:hypothetical protein
VGDHAAGAEQDVGDLLVGDVVGPGLQRVGAGSGEHEIAVLHGQSPAPKPHEAVAVGVGHAGGLEAEASLEGHESSVEFRVSSFE